VTGQGILANHLTITEAARVAGGAAWAERELYEVVGQWARSSSWPAAKLYFDAASQHHAWRGRLWQEQLGGRLVQAHGGPGPSPADVERPFAAAGGLLTKSLGMLEGDVARAAVHCRVVLARCVVEYRALAPRFGPPAGGSLARALSFALADAAEDWAQGTALLAELLEGTADGAEQAASACAEAERSLIGQGPVFGG
jgi:hypothetical protein